MTYTNAREKRVPGQHGDAEIAAPQGEFIIRVRFDPRGLGLPHPLSYYINALNGTFQSRDILIQFEEVLDGIIVYGQNIPGWFEEIPLGNRMSRFPLEIPEWVTEGTYEVVLDFKILEHHLSPSQLRGLGELPIFHPHPLVLKVFFLPTLELGGLLFVQFRIILTAIIEAVLAQKEPGRFFYEDFY